MEHPIVDLKPIPCDCGCGATFTTPKAYGEHCRQVQKKRLENPLVLIVDVSPGSPEPTLPADASEFQKAMFAGVLEHHSKVRRDWDERHFRQASRELLQIRATRRVSSPQRRQTRTRRRRLLGTSRQRRARSPDREPPPQPRLREALDRLLVFLAGWLA